MQIINLSVPCRSVCMKLQNYCFNDKQFSLCACVSGYIVGQNNYQAVHCSVQCAVYVYVEAGVRLKYCGVLHYPCRTGLVRPLGNCTYILWKMNFSSPYLYHASLVLGSSPAFEPDSRSNSTQFLTSYVLDVRIIIKTLARCLEIGGVSKFCTRSFFTVLNRYINGQEVRE